MNKIVAWFAHRQKAVAAWVGANLVWCQTIAAQQGGFHNVSAVEWVALAVANATALGVYTATNTPKTVPSSSATPHGPVQ